MPSYNTPDPMARYSQPLLTELVIQIVAEKHNPEDTWNQMHRPAVPVTSAQSVAPALHTVMADTLAEYKMPSRLHDRIMLELEDLASTIADRLPQDQSKALAAHAAVLAKEPPANARHRGRRYIIDIPDEHLDAAGHALTAAGVEFHHTDNMAMVSPDADLDHLCTPADIPAIIEALNCHLLSEDSSRRLQTNPGTLSHLQTQSFLSIAQELICWSGNRAIDTTRIDEHGGLEKVISSYHPELALLYQD